MKIRTTLNIWLTISVFLLAMGTTAAGGVIYVDATKNGDGSSWTNAYRYLQDALNKPPASGDEIWVAEGTYKPTTPGGDRQDTFRLINGVAIYGGFAGGETSRDQRDIAANVTTLSGDLASNDVQVDPCDLLTEPTRAENSYNVVTGSATNATAILDGFTVTSGNANGSSWPNYYGGGMFNESGSPTVTNCAFSRNSAVLGGSGMYNYSGSSPTVTDCDFSGNSGQSGGGMFNYGYSSPSLTDCTFTDNSAEQGGGMFNLESNPTLANCTFSGNEAGGGGGMDNLSSSPTLTDCTFSGNSASEGGGMLNRQNSSPTVTNCTFSGNSADTGGGMCNANSSPTVTNCTFSGNLASKGGGMRNYESSPTVTNCTFSGNSADDDGGGMYNWANSSPTVTNCMFVKNVSGYNGGAINNSDDMTITNCTFSGNTATSYGGAIYNGSYGYMTLTNSILWGDLLNGEPDEIESSYDSLYVSYCDVEGGWYGTGNIDSDPLFVDPDGPDDISGTEDDNLRLSSGSPCIDAGDNTAVPPDVNDLDGDGDTTEPIPFDLDGNPRIMNGIVDMGAYEEYRLASDIAIQKCKVRAGKKAGQDSINFSGQLDVTADAGANADRIYVEIFSDADDYLVYSEPIDLDLFREKKGKYTYKAKVAKGAAGRITSFKLDTNKGKLSLLAKNIDLTGLGSPLSLEIRIGDYLGVGQADEAIVNGKKFIPIQLMSGYADTLRVDKVRIKSGKRGDSLSVKGAFALKNAPDTIGDVGVTLSGTSGDQTFIIPGDKFYRKGNAWLCKKVDINNGIARAKFDPVKCSFIITIKNASIDSTSGTVDFSISAFGSFKEFVEVNLD